MPRIDTVWEMIKTLTRKAITAKRSAARDRKFRKAAAKINGKYAGLFKRLSE